MKIIFYGWLILAFLFVISCTSNNTLFTGAEGEVKLMTLDPGHFHAALVQKTMYDQVNPRVYIFAPDGPDVKDHIQRINNFNTREENPTHWEPVPYLADDYFEKMITQKPGNVVILSGNNLKKSEYILGSVKNGLNVLADKPMCIDAEGFEKIKQAFDESEKNNVLLYDIMTERYEITTTLQKALSQMPEVFGELVTGSVEEPAVTKESVHHFFKYVSGNPIKRPVWYFDTRQQGEGLVDVTTHLVDLIQWECYPNEILDYKTDIDILKVKRWPTRLSIKQFKKVTRVKEIPEFLKKYINEKGELEVYANGEIIYKLKDTVAKVSVIWNYQAPEGAGDTHYSIMRGSKANLTIRQGAEEYYRPELYVEPLKGIDQTVFQVKLESALSTLSELYPGLKMSKVSDGWKMDIPPKYRVGHEAHFGQVMEKYLKFLVDGKLPDWEVPNMLAKYYTTTSALSEAMK